MSDWLTRAKGLFGGQARQAAEPEPVEIACPCGRALEALRRETFQRVLCKNCGESFFLLPLDVYPRPVMKVRVVSGPRRKDASKSSSPEASSAAKAAAAPAKPLVDVAAVRNRFQQLGQQVAKQFTALRMIVVALLAVIGLTGWWQWNRAARGNAAVVIKQAADAGHAAVAKQDWPAALAEFERAADAANVLGRTDEQGEDLRQWHRELRAINSPLTISMADLFDELRSRRQQENTAAAESAITRLYAGRWIVLQTEMTPAGQSGRSEVEWEQSMLFESEGLSLTGSFPAFANVPPVVVADVGQPADTREVIFAAQFDSVRWDGERSLWVITLNGTTGFLWNHYETLLAAGLSPDELRTEAQLKALLAEQTRWIGAAK